jgi:hypothetical protein
MTTLNTLHLSALFLKSGRENPKKQPQLITAVPLATTHHRIVTHKYRVDLLYKGRLSPHGFTPLKPPPSKKAPAFKTSPTQVTVVHSAFVFAYRLGKISKSM